MIKKYLLPLLVLFLITFSAAFLGSFFTRKSISNWYQFLKKPSFAPPNWLFAPFWALLYILMAIAAFIIYKNKGRGGAFSVLKFYFFQLILNALWSIIFFGLRNPFLAFIEIIFLWLIILLTLIKFYKVEKIAGLLLLPYLFWVTFATILNFSIWLLN
jgi:tryptophan-rich sensory protein